MEWYKYDIYQLHLLIFDIWIRKAVYDMYIMQLELVHSPQWRTLKYPQNVYIQYISLNIDCQQ